MVTMTTMTPVETCEDKFADILTNIKDNNKIKRRKALENIQKTLVTEDRKIQEEWVEFWTIHGVTFISLLSDDSEINRINASEIVLSYAENELLLEKHYVVLIPMIVHRVANIPMIEMSEEVRLLYIQILFNALNKKSTKLCIQYMNDIVNILKVCVLDPSPEVRLLSSDCVTKYAVTTSDKFHMQSASLVKPLIKSLAHQRYKNRISSINALESILVYGDDNEIEEIYGPLAQKMLDIPQVRLAVVKVSGSLAINMKNRYSYWHKILPPLISGLHDNDVDVRSTAESLWVKVGKKYEEENMSALKEEIDHDTVPPHFPTHETRHGVGCRTLVVKSMIYMLPGIINDITDWQTKPRILASRLLITLILNAEESTTQYAEKIISALIIAISDVEQEVVKNALICGEYLGAFLPVKVYLPLLVSRLEASDYSTHTLAVTAALFKGAQSQSLQEVLPSVVSTLMLPCVSHTIEEERQTSLLDVVKCICEKCDVTSHEYELFFTLVLLVGTSATEDLTRLAESILTTLAKKTDKASVEALYKSHVTTILKSLEDSAERWQEHSPEFLMFLTILNQAGCALSCCLEQITRILQVSIPRKSEPMVTLRLFTYLQVILVKHSQDLDVEGQLDHYLSVIIKDCLSPYLPWHAGQTAASLRTGSVACLLAVCDANIASCQETKQYISPCLSLMPALVEDEVAETRLLSCKFITAAHKKFPQLFDCDLLYKLADKVSKRFDDVDSNIRKKAAATIQELFTSLPPDHDVKLQSARLRDLISTMVVYLDDPDGESRKACYGALEVIGKIAPDLMIEILEKEVKAFRNKDMCYQLSETLKAVKIS